MDFIADQLHDGRKIRTLAFIDNFTRECLATTAGANLRNEHLVNTFMQITKASANPRNIFCDNSSDFTGRVTVLWAYTNKYTLAFSRPEKPFDNTFIESFNGSF
tara:strand:- start:3198 stop:3509 length:312 start_codon:yes stop_codon:yes gene_type:complete